jgi:hypothetical protein
MPSRRSFLRNAGAGLALTPGFASVLTPDPLVEQVIGASNSPASLPPSIAALKSMKDRAKPITTEERRARIEQARRLMTERQIDALMLMGGTVLVYFSNIRFTAGRGGILKFRRVREWYSRDQGLHVFDLPEMERYLTASGFKGLQPEVSGSILTFSARKQAA